MMREHRKLPKRSVIYGHCVYILQTVEYSLIAVGLSPAILVCVCLYICVHVCVHGLFRLVGKA